VLASPTPSGWRQSGPTAGNRQSTAQLVDERFGTLNLARTLSRLLSHWPIHPRSSWRWLRKISSGLLRARMSLNAQEMG
jgi:hypothetical protein